MSVNGLSDSDFTKMKQSVGQLSAEQKKQLAVQLNNSGGVVSASQTGEDSLQTVSIEESSSASNISGNDEAQKVSDAYDRQIAKAERQVQDMNRELKRITAKREQLLAQLSAPEVDITSIVSSLNELASSKTELFMQILNANYDIKDLKTQKDIDIDSILTNQKMINELSSQGYDTSAISSLAGMKTIDANLDTGSYAAQLGQSFVGVINSDAQGNKEFSPGGASQHWCADFATSITKRAWQAKGKTLPSDFGSSAVVGLQGWGQKKGVYLDTASNGNRASAIAQQVKPGDLMIQQRNGASHTGIVTKVYPDGSFDTVEGNSSNAVKNRHYDANSSKLSGFVLMSKVA